MQGDKEIAYMILKERWIMTGRILDLYSSSLATFLLSMYVFFLSFFGWGLGWWWGMGCRRFEVH